MKGSFCQGEREEWVYMRKTGKGKKKRQKDMSIKGRIKSVVILVVTISVVALAVISSVLNLTSTLSPR